MSNEATKSTPTKTPIALVTGSSRGIGRAIALALGDRGVDVIVTYRERDDEARSVVAELEKKGRKGHALKLDVAQSSSFPAFAAEVERLLGAGRRLDYLVNNAGSGHFALFPDVTEADLDAMLAVHFKGPFFLTQKLLPLLADGGGIVNVTSGLTRYTYPGTSVYSSVKGAVDVFTRHLARELGPRRIAVNVVAPGGIATDFGGGVMKTEALQKDIIASTPYGRVGQPEDIAGVVAQLCDPSTTWMTGQRLELTGGFML